jgi:hypothetical protein
MDVAVMIGVDATVVPCDGVARDAMIHRAGGAVQFGGIGGGVLGAVDLTGLHLRKPLKRRLNLSSVVPDCSLPEQPPPRIYRDQSQFVGGQPERICAITGPQHQLLTRITNYKLRKTG